MSFAHILWALGIASAFVIWPVLGKYSQASGAWVNTLVLVGTAIGGISLAFPNLRGHPTPTSTAVAWLLIAGLLNGAAVYFYAVKAVDPQVPTGAFIMTVIMSMVILTPVFNYLLNGDVLSVRQWFGLCAALLAIYLLAS